jgi:1-phosphofructokinase family hexose kinase
MIAIFFTTASLAAGGLKRRPPTGYRSRVILCVAANPSIDKLFEVEALLPGAIHRPLGFVQVPGGKGLNVARAAHSLGAEVRAAGILRGHAGRWIEKALRAEGIDGAFVWTHGESRSSLSVADRSDGSLTEFYEHGGEIPSASWIDLMQAVGSELRPNGLITISGSIPRGAPADGYRDLVAEARTAGVRVALDAEGQPLRNAIGAGPYVVKVNAAEATGVLEVSVATRDEALTAATTLRELAGGDGHAGIVTLGADGVVVAGPEGTSYEGILFERARYPVGSGDAFLAGLVVALERGQGWPDALRLALGAATANAEIPGAGKLDGARAMALAAQAVVTEI